MKVLVCGGRDFEDMEWLARVLDQVHAILNIGEVIEGNSRGADRMGGYWARRHELLNTKFDAKWAEHGPAAGPIRNEQMIVRGAPDFVMAFSGGRGTADMVRRSRERGVPVHEVGEDTPREWGRLLEFCEEIRQVKFPIEEEPAPWEEAARS